MKTTNSNKSTNLESKSRQKAAKIAGIMFILAFIVPSLNWALILSKFIVSNDTLSTAKNILANATMFRIGITLELIMSVFLVVLAVTMFYILKNVNKVLATLALSWKLVETSLAVVITLGSLLAILIISNDSNLVGMNSDSLQSFAGFILQKHTILYAIPMIFLGLDMTLFSALFCKSGYIPKWLARFGMISFILILTHSIMYLVAPEKAAFPINQLIFWTPSGIFELVIGTWLLIKGLKIQDPKLT